VGYAVGPRPLIAALHTVKDSYNLGVLPQRLALAALEDVPWMRANAERIRATRRRLEQALRGLGYDVTPSQTNFVWARPLRRAALEVFERLRQAGIIVRHFPGPRTGAHLRITVGTDAEIDRLLDALAAPAPEGAAT
jgi:histidinol-phosphate aminotransferase